MADIWIEFHATRLIKLKKFDDLRKALQMSQYEVLGLLGRFWCEVLELREDGDISDWDADYFANLMVLKLSPERAWKALSNGWIDTTADGRSVVHDWLDCAGKYLARKYKDTDRERLVKIWALHGRVYGEGKSHRSEAESETNRKGSLPNLTIPNLTKPNFSSSQLALAMVLRDMILSNNPKARIKDEQVEKWADAVRLMVEQDKRTEQEIRTLVEWSQKDSFWKMNILSMTKLREKFDQLWIKMTGGDFNAGKGRTYGRFRGGDNTAGTVDPSKYTEAGFPD